MKYVDEYRDANAVKRVIEQIHAVTTQKWNIMEICGGQTHAFLRYGIDELLPDQIALLHIVEIVHKAAMVLGVQGLIHLEGGAP